MGKIDKLILSAYYKNKGCKVKLISFEEINQVIYLQKNMTLYL